MFVTRRRKLFAAGACLAVVLACGVVSGCSGSGANKPNGSALGADAASSVRQAAGSTFDQRGFSLQLSLGVTGAQLSELQRQHPGGGGNHLSGRALDALAKASVIADIYTTNGGTLFSDLSSGHPGDLEFELAVNVNGGAPIDLRIVGSSVYLKFDLQSLAQVFGISTSTVQQFQSVLDTLDGEIPGVAALGHGRWVGADLAPLLRQFQHQTPQPTGQPFAFQTLVNDISQAFTDNSTTRRIGTRNGRTEYNVTFDVGAVVNSAMSSLHNLPGLGQLSGVVPRLPTGKLVTIQVFQTGGKVGEIDLDLNQFLHPRAPFPIPLRFQFGSGNPVSAPQGATKLDISRVIQALGSLASGDSSGF